MWFGPSAVMNDPERHQKSSLVSITLKILNTFEEGSFFLPKTFSQFNFSSIPHLIQKVLQISLTPQTWPPTSSFMRSSTLLILTSLKDDLVSSLVISYNPKNDNAGSNQVLDLPAASKYRHSIMCSCLCVHVHTIAN